MITLLIILIIISIIIVVAVALGSIFLYAILAIAFIWFSIKNYLMDKGVISYELC